MDKINEQVPGIIYCEIEIYRLLRCKFLSVVYKSSSSLWVAPSSLPQTYTLTSRRCGGAWSGRKRNSHSTGQYPFQISTAEWELSPWFNHGSCLDLTVIASHVIACHSRQHTNIPSISWQMRLVIITYVSRLHSQLARRKLTTPSLTLLLIWDHILFLQATIRMASSLLGKMVMSRVYNSGAANSLIQTGRILCK